MALQIDTAPVNQKGKKKSLGEIEFQLPGKSRAPTSTDRMFFTEQLSLLLETGESLYGALGTIVKQTENKKMRGIIEQIAQAVSEGQSFGKALGAA